MAEKDRVAAYIGFARKCGGCAVGAEAVARTRKKIYILFLSRDASANAQKEVEAFAKKRGIPVAVPRHMDLSELVHKPNCKTAGITHKELSAAIIESLSKNENYTIREAGI